MFNRRRLRELEVLVRQLDGEVHRTETRRFSNQMEFSKLLDYLGLEIVPLKAVEPPYPFFEIRKKKKPKA